ncbi:hypothetical protein PACTADRAFT_2044 [Pachysolen tannophilus NRRL Y-2460]|uniref:Urea active transporter n=1 Tax=Pachysolen tannophilus NRRL Y-2460 TaxID=669874 RepID=A0A1E4TVF0_PACTA|nr:hypothetical protein PACTADRAFT_2044 [Pachysolen tannophilus NRRL Y-2460]
MTIEGTILSQAYGYGFVVGLGAAFAILMVIVTTILSKYVGEVQDSEHFSTASRSVKTGLISSAVVSSWTWPGTLLTSSGMTYEYGVIGCMWYAFAFTIQITFFAVIALEIKKKCPATHTIVEVVKVRFGKYAHWIFLFYALGTNVIISAMLLLGGAQAISVLTGMHIVAAAFLLPFSVCLYTMSGGLKATFLSDWIHTVIIYSVILTAIFVAYTSSEHIGSFDKMYDLLTEVSKTFPSEGYEGSYLTMRNKVAIFNAWNIVIGGFSTVFCDPSYGQKAIAAKPLAAAKGYFFGGLSWLIVPWALGSCSALSALALTNNPISPTYPDMISTKEINEGIPMLYGLYCLMGKSGAAAGLLIIFMACTSATSAELVGFSSVITYDVYRTYINPKAHGSQLVKVSHYAVAFFAIAMGALTVVFNYIGITISWIISFIGIILSPAVFGVTLTLFWRKMTPLSLIIGLPLATLTALLSWIGAAKSLYGEVNKTTLGEQYSCAVGNFVSLFSSLIYVIAITYIKPPKEEYDFSTLDSQFEVGDDATKQEIEATTSLSGAEAKKLKFASKITMITAWVIFFILIFIVPMPMYGQSYVFTKSFFRGWIIVIMIWLIIAALYITIFPVYESWDVLCGLFKAIKAGKTIKVEPAIKSSGGSTADISENEAVELVTENYETKT